MCSFVKVYGKASKVKDIIPEIYEMLKIKGGDESAVIIERQKFTSRISYNNLPEDNIWEDNISQICSNESYYNFFFFSRLTPEMEEPSTFKQPYITSNNDIVMVHGTIPRAEEIAKEKNINISVDTEIFQHLPFYDAIEQVQNTGGKISAVSLKHHYNSGLGLYKYSYKDLELISNIDIGYFNKKELPIDTIDDSTIKLVSLYSGGLDITCATQKALAENDYESAELWYFDWGTVANAEEIKAGELAAKEYSKIYYLSVDFKIIDVKDYFSNLLEVCGLKDIRLMNKNSIGAGEAEAEAAISYVPFRNTQLLTLAAARCEQLYPNELVDICIGANLSEGMIYLDNSETFVTTMSKLVKVGGQECSGFNVIAPYVNRTKTAMVKDANENHYLLSSFSCYFPVNGEPCGKCGSCLLKENALKRAEND